MSDFKVTLLGTGSPQLSATRFGPSTLVEAGDQKLLFDAGRAAPIRLHQVKVALAKINALFMTHYHSDHTSGIPDLWLTGWLSGRPSAFHVIGPPGIKVLMFHLEQAYALDIKIRLEDEKLSPVGVATAVEEFDNDGIVFENGGVRVFAFEVDHGEVIKPAVGYRVEYKDRSVVISGDTRFNQNVIKYGTGADVLIHEVCAARPELLTNALAKRIMAHHTSPQEAGEVFSQAEPRLAVYTHFVLLGSATIPALTMDEIISQTRQTYAGPLEVGEDLMSFEIGDTVTVRRHEP